MIVTSDVARAERFRQEVDAAAVFVNASSRFNDGFPVRGRDGMGMVVAKKGGSYGEHPNARRERLKRILKGGPR